LKIIALFWQFTIWLSLNRYLCSWTFNPKEYRPPWANLTIRARGVGLCFPPSPFVSPETNIRFLFLHSNNRHFFLILEKFMWKSYCRSLASLSHPSEDRTLPDRIPNFYEHKRIPQKVHNQLNVGPNARYVCNVYNQEQINKSLKMSNPKYTSTHPNDHSCYFQLQSDQYIFFLMKNSFLVWFYSKPQHKYGICLILHLLR
jgi:hypothetical protein